MQTCGGADFKILTPVCPRKGDDDDDDDDAEDGDGNDDGE